MHFSREEVRVRGRAVQSFNQLHRTWQFQNFWLRVVGRKPAELQALSEIAETHHVVMRTRIGVRSVPVEQIRGSLGRTNDFDAEFRPRTTYNAERWISIAMANAREIEMPAVNLVQVHDSYFVVDGHHRVSVARHRGRLEIDANVEVWQVQPNAQAISACQHVAIHAAPQTDASWWKAWRHTVVTGIRAFVPHRGWRTATDTR